MRTSFADRPIVAGTDGTAGATHAVEWAADEAHRRGLPLRVVHAADRLPYDAPRYPIPDCYDRMIPSGRQLLDHAEKVARDRWPGLEVTTELADGRPGRVLRAQACRAAEVVLGGHGPVGARLAGHVDVPVVVVRPASPGAAAEIVAGFDGSHAATPALAYAFEEARLSGHRLRVVCAWEPPISSGPRIAVDTGEIGRIREDRARRLLTAWRDRFADVETELDMVRAHPVSALVDASARAALLVVGSHGRNALTVALLGSVSRAMLEHARCPVAVVRHNP
ncbi:universal stress protein [Microbispora sp. NBC_01389]|uniref:universal stress protein n=1 Tax=Microbispora sp. NBC_01389 TaxID=2903584 RepID=UPI0032477B29